MNRFWSFQTKLVMGLVLLLLGALLLQSYIHDLNKDRLFVEVENLTLTIANDVTDKLARGVAAPSSTAASSGSSASAGLWTRSRLPGRNPKASRARPVSTLVPREKEIEGLMEKLRLRDRQGIEDRLRLWVVLYIQKQTNPHLPPSELGGEFGTEPVLLSGRGYTPTGETGMPSVPVYRPLDSAAPLASSIGEISVGPYIDRMQSLFDGYRRLDLLATVGVFILGIGVAWFLGMRITRPVHEIIEGFQGVAEGDLETRVADTRRDEFGLLGRQFNHMVQKLQENLEMERELASRERVRHMGDLAAGVAHDIRNPLNAIHLNIGQIRDEFLPSESERARQRFIRFTSDIQSEVERLNQLVGNFLSLAQPAGASLEPVQPNELLDELGRLLKKEAADRHVRLTLDLDEELPVFNWNRQEMKSALLNVALNALQAMEPEGGSLSLITGVRPDAGEAVVTIVDSGCGISEQNLERVTVPYFTTRKGGTGLGLAMALRFCERNGGRLDLRSSEGEGTSVSFVFPLEERVTV